MIRHHVLSRPGKYNSLTLEMIAQLTAEILEKDNTRVLILSGAGDHFSTGADLKGDVPAIFKALAQLYQTMTTSPKVIIAAIDGYCLAGGFGLAAAADLALATPEASFSLPETRRGLLAPLAAAFAKPLLPKRLLAELALAGEPLPAGRLYEAGFLNYLVPQDELLAAATRFAEQILKGGPQAISLTKQMLNPQKFSLDEALAWQQKAFNTGEVGEGLRAFQEKRLPKWDG